MTFFTVPRRCSWPFGLGELPVDSITTCAPSDSQSSLAGSFSEKTLDLLAVHRDGVVRGGNLVLQVSEDRVVLQQMRQRLGLVRSLTATISSFCRLARYGDVAANAAESINAYLNCHVASRKNRQIEMP